MRSGEAGRMSPSPSMSLRSRAVALVLLACCQACSIPPLDAARLSLGAAVLAYDAALPSVERERAADGAACLSASTPAAEAEPCLVAVRARWAPVRAAVERAWAALEAARAVLALAEAVDAMGGRVEVARVRAAVLAAVEAVGVAVAGVGP